MTRVRFHYQQRYGANMPRIFDMARIRKREEQKKAAETRTDFPGSDLREAVLLGTADAWPEPDLAEVITVDGAVRTVSGLTSGECTTASVALMKSIVELARKLRVKLENYIPAAPLKAEDFTAENRPLSRELNGYCLTLRAVRRQKEILEAATAALARKEHDRYLLAKQRLIDEAPAALERVNKALSGLDDAVTLVDAFVDAVRKVSSAPELISFAQRLRAAAEKAGARNLPPVPSLNGHDAVVAMRLAKVAGILPVLVNERDYEMANAGRAAIAKEQG
jgi:hypothetical protein